MLDQTIIDHLPLVRSIAKCYVKRGLDYEDLVQEGTAGLMKAAKRYDSEKDNGFAAFVTPRIHGEIKNALIREANQRNPPDSVSFDEYPELKDEIVDPSPSVENIVCSNELMAIMNACLTERQQVIITMRYIDDMSQTEVARHLGISQPAVAHLEARALAKLKARLGGYEF